MSESVMPISNLSDQKIAVGVGAGGVSIALALAVVALILVLYVIFWELPKLKAQVAGNSVSVASIAEIAGHNSKSLGDIQSEASLVANGTGNPKNGNQSSVNLAAEGNINAGLEAGLLTGGNAAGNTKTTSSVEHMETNLQNILMGL